LNENVLDIIAIEL